MEKSIQFERTSLLQIAYETHGRAEAGTVLLPHGWPGDLRTWDGVVE
jgi:pimeloyl-ACP methyl ester carboxylesterase